MNATLRDLQERAVRYSQEFDEPQVRVLAALLADLIDEIERIDKAANFDKP